MAYLSIYKTWSDSSDHVDFTDPYLLNKLDIGTAAQSFETNQLKNGKQFLASVMNDRTITITGYILEDSKTDSTASKHRLQQICSPASECVLHVDDYKISVRVKNSIKWESDHKDNNSQIAKFTISLVAFDPYFVLPVTYDSTTKKYTIPSPIGGVTEVGHAYSVNPNRHDLNNVGNCDNMDVKLYIYSRSGEIESSYFIFWIRTGEEGSYTSRYIRVQFPSNIVLSESKPLVWDSAKGYIEYDGTPCNQYINYTNSDPILLPLGEMMVQGNAYHSSSGSWVEDNVKIAVDWDIRVLEIPVHE